MEDEKYTGRKRIIIEDKEIKLLANIRLNRNNTEKLSKILVYKTSISVSNT